jgi:hypothetical protein
VCRPARGGDRCKVGGENDACAVKDGGRVCHGRILPERGRWIGTYALFVKPA